MWRKASCPFVQTGKCEVCVCANRGREKREGEGKVVHECKSGQGMAGRAGQGEEISVGLGERGRNEGVGVGVLV